MKKDESTNMISNLINNNEFTVIDIETSGLSPLKGGRIIEIGAVIIKENKIIKKYNQLINPEQKLYKKTIDLTGITNEMVSTQPIYSQVLPEFYDTFIKDKIVVFQNANFDWERFLKHYFKKVGIIANELVIDIMKLSKHCFKENKKHNLQAICNQFGINTEGSHRAINDAYVTAKALLKFKTILKKENINNISFLTDNKINNISKMSEINDVKIKRIKYWEKQMNGNKMLRRIYITTDIGIVFFDIISKTWNVKELKKEININFKLIEHKVLGLLKLNSQEELINFRN